MILLFFSQEKYLCSHINCLILLEKKQINLSTQFKRNCCLLLHDFYMSISDGFVAVKEEVTYTTVENSSSE